MPIRCRSCQLDFPFDPSRAGEVVECPYCDRYNTLPETDPEGSSAEAIEPAEEAAAEPEPVPAASGWAEASSFALACPQCRTELKLFQFDRPAPVCPDCGAALADVEKPTSEQILSQGISPEGAAQVEAIFSRLVAQRQKEASARPRLVAEWLVSEFDRHDRRLSIAATAAAIREQFGAEFTEVDGEGRLTVARSVLEQFRWLTTNCVVYDLASGFWRERRPGEDLVPRVRVPRKRQGQRRKKR